MLNLLVAEILGGTAPEEEVGGIYIVQDGDFTIYVGKTQHGVFHSIRRHCGLGPGQSSADALGSLIIANAPESGSWHISFLGVRDCRQFVTRAGFDKDAAEAAMIEKYRPVLSDVKLQNAPALPKHYRR